MGAPEVLSHLSALGVRLTREGEAIRAAPRSALTDEARALIRAHKPEILAALPDQPPNVAPPDPTIAPDEYGVVTASVYELGAEARRQRLLAMLAERPGIRYAVSVDTEADSEAVILALAIRGAMRDNSTVTGELLIPRSKYNPFLLLGLIERRGWTMH